MSEKLKDLLAQKAALEQKIEEAARSERAEAIAKVRALMGEHGLSLADLSVRGTPRKARGGGGGGKVAAKYRNAATGQRRGGTRSDTATRRSMRASGFGRSWPNMRMSSIENNPSNQRAMPSAPSTRSA